VQPSDLWFDTNAVRGQPHCDKVSHAFKLIPMKPKFPLNVASILICLSISACFDNGQTAGTVNSPTPVVSPTSSDSTANKQADTNEPVMLKGPNAIPKDTRIVVNIPAFRMDVFQDGTLLKSYKIGIGYQQFPLPTGFRKAEQIIFNPTWTQPNESWASDPGAVTPAGAAGNPLGPIKVPIGGANLIHGGKSLAKIGTFASHGCVGLTNDEVKDFVRTLADATKIDLTDDKIAGYLKHRTRTQVVKIPKSVPVELRYETILIQDGQLHVYRDVYTKNTNTEENLRAAFEANGASFDKLSEAEKTQALEAVNAMSLHPKKQQISKPTVAPNQTAEERKAAAAERRAEAQKQAKLRTQKEIVIDITELSGKGYPSPKDLHTGAGTVASNSGAPPLKPKPRRNPSPAPQSTPEVVPPPRSTVSPQ
jgi:lipoprotein-anchoring transpeptidase ErfK/SrfK